MITVQHYKLTMLHTTNSLLVRGVVLFLVLGLLLSLEREASSQTIVKFPSIRQAVDSSKDKVEPVPLEVGKPIEREMKAGDSHSYRIDLTSGQFLHVTVEQKGIDVVVALFGMDGKRLVELNVWVGTQGIEQVSWIAEATGSYRLEVHSLKKGAETGRYEVKVEELRQATQKDRIQIDAQKASEEGDQLLSKQTKESYKKAMEKYSEAAELFRSANNRFGEAVALGNIGLINFQLGGIEKALDYYKNALLLWQAISDRSGEAETLNNIGVVYRYLGKPKDALEYYNKALPLRQALGDRSGEAETVSNIGVVYDFLGEKQKALEYYGKALPLRQATGDRSGEALTLNNIGVVYDSIGEKQKALEYDGKALLLRQAIGDHSGEAQTLNNIGVVYNSLGEQQKALEYYNRALTLWREVGNRNGEGYTLNSMGTSYSFLGENQKALDYSNRAFLAFRDVKNPYGEAFSLTNMGNIYIALGENQKALDTYSQALEFEQATGERFLKARTLNGIGKAYNIMGDKERALVYYGQVLELEQAVGDRYGEASVLNNIGTIYLSLGEMRRALEYFNQALILSQAIDNPSIEAATLLNIAQVKRDSGELIEAHLQAERALNLVESLRAKIAVQDLRTSYFTTIQSYYEFYIDLLMRLNQQNPSADYSILAFQASERARARILLEALIESRAGIRQGISPELLGKEQSLQQQLNGKADYQLKLLNSKPTPEQREAVKREIEAAKREVERLTEELQKIEAQIRRDSPRYAELVYPEPLSLSEIQQQVLDDDTMLLEYSLNKEQSYLWTVTRTSIASYQLPGREEIERAALRVYNLFTSRERKKFETDEALRQRVERSDLEYEQAAADLSRMLLAPISEALGGKRLLIVGDGLLQYIPFGVLPLPEALKQGSRRRGERLNTEAEADQIPLIVEHEIVSLPSASALAVQRRELAERKSNSKTIAMFANPIFAEDKEQRSKLRVSKADTEADEPMLGSMDKILSGLEPLPETEQMAREVLALLPREQSKLLVRFDANLAAATNAELSKYRILHFATHGFLNPNPELSGIMLSQVDQNGREQNGFLSASAIFNLNLSADLVVLSACKTGLALDPLNFKKADEVSINRAKDQGFAGLTRGFVYAGAERVIVTLWDIPVVATNELMLRFYKEMLGKRRLSASAALREAQIQMWRQQRWRAPFYWAAFIISGEYK